VNFFQLEEEPAVKKRKLETIEDKNDGFNAYNATKKVILSFVPKSNSIKDIYPYTLCTPPWQNPTNIASDIAQIKKSSTPRFSGKYHSSMQAQSSSTQKKQKGSGTDAMKNASVSKRTLVANRVLKGKELLGNVHIEITDNHIYLEEPDLKITKEQLRRVVKVLLTAPFFFFSFSFPLPLPFLLSFTSFPFRFFFFFALVPFTNYCRERIFLLSFWSYWNPWKIMRRKVLFLFSLH